MKKIGITQLALALSLLGWGGLSGQHKVCGSDELRAVQLQDPRYRSTEEAQEAQYQEYVRSSSGQSRDVVRTIPVVVHFIQSSDIPLVDDAMVYSQLAVLNEDFRKMAGTRGDGNGVDTQYEFCLASIDPSGCPTTGINRVVGGQWAYHKQSDAAIMKGLIQWDPRRYLNIWVPRTIETSVGSGQVIGYATFPTNLSVSPNLDGVVIHSGYFGRESDLTYIGRTTTHEVGHWTGLFHTFQGNCTGASANTCTSQGDRVCDTPQAATANFGCPSINSCTDSPTDFSDQIENYMDYSDGTCQNMYTQGQKDRMDFFFTSIRSQIWSATNLTSTGCDGTVATCAPGIDFEADNIIVCVGQPVQFTDLSSHTPTGWNWTFTGGSPATSSSQNPSVVYNTAGSYDVVLSATNGTGSASETKFAYVTVVEPTPNGLVQGFEGILNLPQNWMITDNQGSQTWKLATNARSQGQNSMKVKNFEARNDGESMNLHSNPFSLSNMISGYMTFDYSYKKFSGLVSDALKVHISTDCGASWQELWSKSGPYLATVAGSSTTAEWVPTQASQWLSDTIVLDSFAGEPNVKVRFEVVSGGGQTVYLDNINMNLILVGAADPAAFGWDFQVAPNPFQQDLRITYSLQRPSSLHFSLTDVSGRMIGQVDTGSQSAGRHELVVESLRSLPAGVYFLKGTGAAGSITRKVVKLD